MRPPGPSGSGKRPAALPHPLVTMTRANNAGIDRPTPHARLSHADDFFFLFFLLLLLLLRVGRLVSFALNCSRVGARARALLTRSGKPARQHASTTRYGVSHKVCIKPQERISLSLSLGKRDRRVEPALYISRAR